MTACGKRSRDKGQRGEREVAEVLRRYGVEAKRGYQARGGSDEADVEHSMPGIRLEVKRTETLRLWEALTQAERDLDPADDVTVPVLVFRRNRSRWYACLPLEDWLRQLGYDDA